MPAQFNKNASFRHAYLTCRNTAVSNRRRGRQEKEGEITPLIWNTLNISLCLNWMEQEESRTNIAVFPSQKGCGTGWRSLDSTLSVRLEVDTAFSSSLLQRRNWRLQSSKWEWCQFFSPLAPEFLPPSSSLKCPRIWTSWLGNMKSSRIDHWPLFFSFPSQLLQSYNCCRVTDRCPRHLHLFWTVHPGSVPPPSMSQIITFIHHYTERSIVVVDIHFHLLKKMKTNK